jgi:thiamine biosynthesis lipoprotein
MREHRTIMGMPAQLEIIGDAPQAVYDGVFEYLNNVDTRFSTYQEESEISAINRGDISEEQFSPEMKEVLTLSEQTREVTNGYFNIRTPEGLLDPSGLVKGWAIYHAARMLEEQGYQNYYLEIAGDIQTKGVNAEGRRSTRKRRRNFRYLYPRRTYI